MPPKIEELPIKSEPVPSGNKEIKNPFAPKKKSTIRRNAQDIYPDKNRKGLNVPDYLGNSPLDKLFQRLQKVVEGDLDDIDISTLQDRMLESSLPEFELHYKVIEKLLDHLIEIRDLSNKSEAVNGDENLIKISLHDIKTFGKLVNLIIIHGIYPALGSFRIGIPFEKRRLNDFAKSKKPIKIKKLPEVPGAKSYKEKFGNSERLLRLIYSKLKIIFSEKSDVQELLIKGTGYSDFLTVSAAMITIPYFDSHDKPQLLSEYNDFVTRLPDTFELFQTYSLLITTPSPPYFKQFIMSKLLTLHYDADDGISALCEFILGLRDSEEINIEKFENVSNVILLKPKSINTVDYFKKIGVQIYTQLVNIDKPVITSCLGFVTDRLWNKNQLVARDFIFKHVWKNFNPENNSQSLVLVGEAALNNNINVLISLTKSNLSGELLSNILQPILLPIWSYYTFLKSNSKSTEVISQILISYFTITSTIENENSSIALNDLNNISKNLLIMGSEYWQFEFGPNGLLQIVKDSGNPLGESSSNKINSFLDKLDLACVYFTDLLKELDDDLIQGLFALILKRWLGLEENSLEVSFDSKNEDAFFVLIDLRLLEKMGNEFKDSLAKTPMEMLEIVKSFLLLKKKEASKPSRPHERIVDSDDDSDDEDVEEELSSNILPIVLELLSVILSEASDLDQKSNDLLRDIQKLLKSLLKSQSESQTISNSIQALHDRIKILLDGDTKPTSTSDLHSKIFKRAITSLNDPLVPIRAHGLYLLRQLIELKSSVISLDFVINLHLINLKDPEPYIYLNVIKGLESLLEFNERDVLPHLISIYLNKQGDTELDERLKVGEVLLRYIQLKNEMFSGDMAALVFSAGISLIRVSKDDSDIVDDRLRMSAMSLLGTCCNTNPIGVIDKLTDALDCVFGILQLETSKDKAIMRRSAIVLINDLILGTSSSDKISFPREYQEKVTTILRYIVETDNDLLAKEQAQTVLDTIDYLIKASIQTIK